jgi:hypothetical protein
MVDPEAFNLDDITRLKGDDETDGENFVWKNLNTFEESLSKSWLTNTDKDIFELVPLNLQKIVTDGDKEEIHKLVIVVVTTLIMLSKIDSAFQILNDILNVGDAKLVEYGKTLTQDLVTIFTEFSGVQNENEDDPQMRDTGFSPSPFKKSATGGSLSPLRRKTSEFSNNFLEKFDKNEKELIKLKKEAKEKDSKIIDLETQNQELKDKLEKKTSEFDKLTFENEDFKKRANLGMTEILELELN